MLMNAVHPNFSPAMELLLTLPLRVNAQGQENWAAITDLVADIGAETQRTIKNLLAELDAMGIKIERWTDRELGKLVAVCPESWTRAKLLAENYWESVYGGMPTAA